MLEELRPPNSIKFLRIWDYYGLNFPRWMEDKLLLQQLVELHMGYCTRLRHLPPVWLLKSLKVLSLIHMDNMKYVISDGAGDSTLVQAFTSLKELRLSHLESLEYWWENNYAVHPMASNCFPALFRLEITRCPELAGLMPLAPSLKEFKLVESKKIVLGPMHLKGLGKLSIKALEEGALIWHDQEEEDGVTTGFVQCLKRTEIDSCDWIFSYKFSTLWRSMTSLESLSIGRCHALVDLPEVLRGLNSMRSLELSHCSSLNSPVPSNMNPRLPQHLEHLKFISCQRLTTMPSWSIPSSLKSFTLDHCTKLVSLTAAGQELGSLPFFEVLSIYNCSGLKSLASGMERLTALRSLGIEDCPELTTLPQGLLRRLSALEDLYLDGCPELEEKCSRGGEYWGLVSHVPRGRVIKFQPPSLFSRVVIGGRP